MGESISGTERQTLQRVVDICKESGMPPEGEVNQFEWLRERLARPPAVAFPQELTPALKAVLSLMLWHCGQLAEAWRIMGHDIPRRAEDEQAYVLHRLIPLAIAHGDQWRKIVADELTTGRAVAKAAGLKESADG